MSQLKLGAVLSYVIIFVSIITGVFLTPYMIKQMGDGEYGLYILIGSLIGYISVLDFGIGNTIVRYIAKYRAEKDKDSEQDFLGTTFYIYCGITLIILILGSIGYFFLNSLFGASLTPEELSKGKILYKILLFNLFFTLPGGVFYGVITGYEHFVFPRLLDLLRYIVRATFIFIFLHYGYGAIMVVVVDTILNFIMLLLKISYARFKLNVTIPLNKFKKSIMIMILSYSFWIFLNVLMDQFYWKVGQTVLGVYTNTSVVAIYAVSISLVLYYMTFSSAISGVFLPRATQMFVNNATGKELTQMMIKVGRYQWLILLLVLSGFYFFGEDFIRLWLGEQYLSSKKYTMVLMIALTVPLLQNFGISILRAYNKHKVRSVLFVIISFINLLLGIFLSEEYGAWGMVIATALSLFLGQGIAINIYYHFKIGLNIPLFFRKILQNNYISLPLILLVGCLLNLYLNMSLTWFNLFFKIMVYTICYAFIQFFIVMNKEEKQLLVFTPMNKIVNFIR